MMSWFSKQLAGLDSEVAPKKPNLFWKTSATEFNKKGVQDYIDPHLGVILLDVLDVIPPKYHDKVYIAGGFAAHAAGITKEHGDVDIFCNSATTFDELTHQFSKSEVVKQVGDLVEEKKYGRLMKYETPGLPWSEMKFDLVDISPSTGVPTGGVISIVDVLESFDINWCMAGITLTEPQTMWTHPKAYSTILRINIDQVRHLEGTHARIEKYGKRLTRSPDLSYAEKMANALDDHLAQKARDTDLGS